MNMFSKHDLTRQDLRIGNRFCLELSNQKYECVVKEIGSVEILVSIKKIGVTLEVSLSKLIPIEVTETSLINSEFECLNPLSTPKRFFYKSNKDVCFEMISKEYGAGGYSFKGTWFPCTYYHELQNLLYITSKIELK